MLRIGELAIRRSATLLILGFSLTAVTGTGFGQRAEAQAAPRGRVPPGSLATSTIMWNLDSACTGGDHAACDTLAMHHWAGGDKAERKIAVALWQDACESGGAGACANLG